MGFQSPNSGSSHLEVQCLQFTSFLEMVLPASYLTLILIEEFQEPKHLTFFYGSCSTYRSGPSTKFYGRLFIQPNLFKATLRKKIFKTFTIFGGSNKGLMFHFRKYNRYFQRFENFAKFTNSKKKIKILIRFRV
jgi:hypothetical protein